MFNVVILPVAAGQTSAGQVIACEAPPPLFQLSATRNDRGLRLVSPHWSEPELRTAFALVHTPDLHIAQLLRGNRMVFGGRDNRKLSFTVDQLLTMGLTPEPARDPEQTGLLS